MKATRDIKGLYSDRERKAEKKKEKKNEKEIRITKARHKIARNMAVQEEKNASAG